jgi:glycosyltransferase involved in cell wall biosynthesis
VRLGLVVPGGFDPSGREGIIPALLALTEELGRRHDVRVFAAASRSGAAQYRIAGAAVTQLGRPDGVSRRRGPLGFAQGAARLARLARSMDHWLASVEASGPLDLMHAFWADRTALLAAWQSRQRRIPLVVSVGGGEAIWLPEIRYGGASSRTGRAVTRAALRVADVVTAGSAFALGPLPRSVTARAQVVPLGVAGATFAAPPARPSGPPWRLLQVAGLVPVKDHLTALLALRRAVERLGDVRLDCVGEDSLGGAVQRRAAELGLGARVSFHGFLTQDRLAALYRRAHLNLLSSRYESQGVVILEAAAAGLPTVGTAVGLLPSLAPEAARCVAPGDSLALGDVICELLLDRPAREAMGAAAQHYANAHDATWTAQAFERIYASRLARADSDPLTRSCGTSAGRGRTS